MAEVITITRVGVEECKQLIADKYHVDPKKIKFWNGKFEFEAKKNE